MARVIPEVANPFCEIVLRASKPLHKDYPAKIEQIGDYIRAKRLDMGLYQSHVAPLIGVDKSYLSSLEKNYFHPKISLWPGIIAFLGYDPFFKDPEDLSERLKHHRRWYGLNAEKVGKRIHMDPATVIRIEREPERCMQKSLDKMRVYLEGCEKLDGEKS